MYKKKTGSINNIVDDSMICEIEVACAACTSIPRIDTNAFVDGWNVLMTVRPRMDDY